mmetsp:Transcript_24501/g.36345  ORF Transcript_24501/g.36345 Transcript_24501/m.36345 type:complete len:452 (+) Transcript_24501:132-1487(+)
MIFLQNSLKIWTSCSRSSVTKFVDHHVKRNHRFLSSSTSEASIEETSKSLNWMSSEVSFHGESATKEWANKLSPSAREELMQLRRSSTSSNISVPEPSREDLKLVMVQAMIPFFGFGIMDNSILIIAGDLIDSSLGVMLGISTMCAAAIGNIISDVAGIGLGTIIEDFTAKLGLPIPAISAAQRQLRSVRLANQMGNAIGIVVGCIVGMFPLLFLDTDKAQKGKQEKQMAAIFADVISQAKELIGAEKTNLFVIVDSLNSTTPIDPSKRVVIKRRSTVLQSKRKSSDKQELYFYSKFGETPLYIPAGEGVVWRTAKTGRVQNVINCDRDPDVAKNLYKAAFPDLVLRTMVCVPVKDTQGRVIGVLQGINKIQRGNVLRRHDSYVGSTPAFTRTDFSVLQVLASHISVSLQTTYELEEDAGWSLKNTISILKEQGLAGINQNQYKPPPQPEP